MNHSRRRRFIASLVIIGISAGLMLVNPENYYSPVPSPQTTSDEVADSPSVRQAIEVLDELDVKGRAPKTGYTRSQFGQGWSLVDGCDMRNIILLRDLADTKVDEQCRILSGRLDDPYTGKVIYFERGPSSHAQNK